MNGNPRVTRRQAFPTPGAGGTISRAFAHHISPVRGHMPADDTRDISRRTFVKASATTAAAMAFGPMIVPRHVLGGVGYRAPSDTLNVAMVGIGGMGKQN